MTDNTITKLPDGSAFAVASWPLPKDHWLYAPRGEWDSARDEYVECPPPILTQGQHQEVTAAVRYAIRGATMCGQEPDFDPDALVLNAVYALCGPFVAAPKAVAPAAPAAPVVIPHEWRSALRKLAFMARTGGGTAGPDSGLMAACAEAEALLSKPYLPAPTAAPTGETVAQEPDDWAPLAGEPMHIARDALDAIRRYGLDTLSGRADGGEDCRQWHRQAVNAITRRARLALEALAVAAPAPVERQPLTGEQIEGMWNNHVLPGFGDRQKFYSPTVYARIIEKACAKAWGVKLAGSADKGGGAA